MNNYLNINWLFAINNYLILIGYLLLIVICILIDSLHINNFQVLPGNMTVDVHRQGKLPVPFYR